MSKAPPLCGIVVSSSWHDPVACAFPPGHDGNHSWASIPALPPMDANAAIELWLANSGDPRAALAQEWEAMRTYFAEVFDGSPQDFVEGYKEMEADTERLKEALLPLADLLTELGQWFIDEQPEVPMRLQEVVLEIEARIGAALSAGVSPQPENLEEVGISGCYCEPIKESDDCS